MATLRPGNRLVVSYDGKWYPAELIPNGKSIKPVCGSNPDDIIGSGIQKGGLKWADNAQGGTSLNATAMDLLNAHRVLSPVPTAFAAVDPRVWPAAATASGNQPLWYLVNTSTAKSTPQSKPPASAPAPAPASPAGQHRQPVAVKRPEPAPTRLPAPLPPAAKRVTPPVNKRPRQSAPAPAPAPAPADSDSSSDSEDDSSDSSSSSSSSSDEEDDDEEDEPARPRAADPPATAGTTGTHTEDGKFKYHNMLDLAFYLGRLAENTQSGVAVRLSAAQQDLLPLVNARRGVSRAAYRPGVAHAPKKALAGTVFTIPAGEALGAHLRLPALPAGVPHYQVLVREKVSKKGRVPSSRATMWNVRTFKNSVEDVERDAIMCGDKIQEHINRGRHSPGGAPVFKEQSDWLNHLRGLEHSARLANR